MAEIGTETGTDIDEGCESIRTVNCPANWDQSSTLVFRQVRGGGVVTVSPQYLTVDIRVHTDVLQAIQHSQKERVVFTLSWGCEDDTPPCQSTITIQVKKQTGNVHSALLNTLSRDGFQKLRQFANAMFQEYKTRITSVSSPPVSFNCTNKDKTAMDSIASSVQELKTKFTTYILDNSDFDFEFNIRSDDFRSAEINALRSRRSLMDIGSGPSLSLSAQEDDKLNLEELERLETLLRAQAVYLESVFREQKQRHHAMRSTLRSLMERETEQPGDVQATLWRDSGDGAEVFTSTPDSKPTQELPTSKSNPLQSKLAPVSRSLQAPPSSWNTLGRLQTSNQNSQTLALSNSDIAILTLSNGSNGSTTNPALQETLDATEQRTSSVKLTATSKEYLKSSNEAAKPTQAQNRKGNEPRNSQQQSSSANEVLKSEYRRTSNQSTFEGEESPFRAQGMDIFLCFHITDKKETDKNIRQQMKDAALKYIQCVEDIASEHDIEENIALIAKEKQSWLKKKPTIDYSLVRANIENLSLEYPTSLVEAIKAANDFMKSAGHRFKVGDRYRTGVRLIVISNHVSSSYLYGSPAPFPCDKKEFGQVKEAFDNVNEAYNEVAGLIIVGNADRKFFGQLQNVSSLMSCEVADIRELSEYQMVQVAAGRAINYYLEQGKEMSGNIGTDAETLTEVFGSHLQKDGQGIVKGVIRDLMILHDHGSDKHQSETVTTSALPPLGSRVVRGEDWKWSNQDSQGPGTVIEHLGLGTVAVEWDNGFKAKYRYGEEGAFDIKVVHDQLKENTSNSSIDVGCEVVRGPDWESGNEDGGPGSVGVVIHDGVLGVLKVRWYESGTTKAYRFGREGKYAVMLRDIHQSSGTTTRSKDTCQNESARTDSEMSPVTPQGKPQACSMKNSLDSVQENSLDSVQEKSFDSVQVKSLDSAQEKSLDSVQEKSLDSVQEKSLDCVQEKSLDSVQERSLDCVQEKSLDSVQEKSLDSVTDNPLESVQEMFESEQKKSLDNEQEKFLDSVQEKTFDSDQKESLVTSKAEPPGCSLKESLVELQEKSHSSEVVWQWLDNGVTWRPYSLETSHKLEASFNLRPTGSCLVKRESMSYRVLFKQMEEKSVVDNTRRKVQRTSIPQI